MPLSNLANHKYFFRNVSIFLGGSLIFKAINLLIFLLLGNLLNPLLMAQYALFFMFSGLISLGSTFGLRSGIMRIAWKDKKAILTNSLALTIAFSCGLLLAFFAGQSAIIALLPDNYLFLEDYFLLAAFKAFFTSIVGIISTYYVSREQPYIFVKVNTFLAFINLVPLALAFLFDVFNEAEDLLFFVFLAQVVSGLIAATYAIFISRSEWLISKVSIRRMVSIISIVWVFFVKQILGFFQTYSATIVISFMATMDLLGVYSFYGLLLTQLGVLQSSFFKAYTPKIKNLIISKSREKTEKAIKLVKKSAQYFLYISIFSTLITLFSLRFIQDESDIFLQVVKEEYILNLDLFFYMFCLFFLSSFRQVVDVWQYTLHKSIPRNILLIQVMVLIMMYLGSIYLMPIFGIYGILINQAFVSIFVLVVNSWLFNRIVVRSLLS